MFSLDGFGNHQQEKFDPLGNEPRLSSDYFNHCLTSFYDNDSDHLVPQSTNCSVQQVICSLQHTLDIRDTPLPEIMKAVKVNPCFKEVDLQLLSRKLIKMKNNLKRERAKNRKNNAVTDHLTQPYKIILEDEEEELKKQKNRISAQMSRDRKKEKVKALEQLNRQLQEQCQQQKAENQRLKKQAKESKQSQSKSPFARMIIFLGIFFLFTVVKDVLSSSESAKAITKIQQNTTKLLFDQNQSFPPFMSQRQAFETIEEGLAQGIGQLSTASKVAQGVKAKLSGLWDTFNIPMLSQAVQKDSLQTNIRLVN